MSTKPLTLTLITQKAKTEAHYSIKKLNLCANSLDDLSLLERLPNLEVLSLSVNCINSLQDIVRCKNLRELYLRKNNISDPKQLAYLQQLPNLKILWLQENPIADHPNYRELVLSNCQTLENLDDQAVTPPKIIHEDLYEEPKLNSNRYQSTPQHFKQQPYASNPVRQSVEIQQSQSPQAAIQLQMKQQQEYQQQQLLLKQQQQQQEYQYQQLLLQQQQFQEQQQAAFQKQQQQQIQIQAQSQELSVERNENILCAVLSLLKELDPNSLAVVQRELERQLRLFEQ